MSLVREKVFGPLQTQFGTQNGGMTKCLEKPLHFSRIIVNRFCDRKPKIEFEEKIDLCIYINIIQARIY